MKKNLLLLLSLACLQTVFAQGELHISNGATLYTSGSSTVTLHDTKLNNNGTFTANDGTLLFSGTAANAASSIEGTGTSSFKNLTINKSSNSVQLNQNVSVAGNLNLLSGGLELNNGNVDFGTTGSLQNETETNRVYGANGELIATADLNAPAAANPANLGVALTSAADLGATEVRRSHSVFTENGNSIARSYKVVPTNNSGLNATLRFYYFDAELNGNDENVMVAWSKNDLSDPWASYNMAARDTTNNWLELNSLGDIAAIWTFANLNALPVEMLYFTGEALENANFLTWATATEENNAGFEIQKSTDARTFKKIGFVIGNGTTYEQQTYNFLDEDVANGTAYYRLKQMDFNGKFEYSNIVALSRNGAATAEMLLYPNPVQDLLTIENGEGFATIYNALGQPLQQFEITDTKYFLNVNDLSSGIYKLQVRKADGTATVQQFVK